MTDEQALISILTETPVQDDRRRSIRVPSGTLAAVRQIINADPLNPVHVLITDVSDGGLGLRSPIGLVRGGLYRVEASHTGVENASNVKVVSSRRRPDGSYEVGTRYV